MTEEELNEIKSHLKDHTQNWDVRIAQRDRIRLLAEVDRLQKQLQDLTGVVPDPGGGGWFNGAYYDCKPCFECGETDQTHDFKCSKHPSNAVCLDCGGSIAEHQYHGFDGSEWRCIEPTTDNAVTGSLSREGKGSLDAP